MTDKEKIPLWYNDRFRKILLQAIIVILVLIALIFFGNNLVQNFQRLGLKFGFDFLFDSGRPASFGIGDTPIEYSPSDPYSRAILVGLLNSLRIMVSGIILATIVGIIVGLGRLSDNWLVRQLATVYVETFRNTPLLLQLFFWYFAVFLKLPKIDNPLSIFGTIFLTNRGLDIPWLEITDKTWLSLFLIFLSIIFSVLSWRKGTQTIVQRGRANFTWTILAIGFIIAAISTFIFDLDWQYPQFNSTEKSIQQGLHLSSEFATLLVGLTIYTAAFIAEGVRAGIQSVSIGQWEAARALGLKPSLVMRLVIFPQALRVMIPPLTSEYLNLAKNSSLAIAIGYNDIYAVSSTISNKTGKAVEMLLIVMGTYLLFNLFISTGMNWFNAKVQIKER